MSNYWPSDLSFSNTQSPREILEVAKEDWYANSEGVMELVLQDAESESGNSMIIVYAKHVLSNRTSKLFSIVHRPNNPYPVTIQLEDENIPNFLKKSYTRPGLPGLSSIGITPRIFEDIEEETISNLWVSDTPPEFRKKLAEAFNLGDVKSGILNLALSASNASDDTNGESQEDSGEK